MKCECYSVTSGQMVKFSLQLKKLPLYFGGFPDEDTAIKTHHNQRPLPHIVRSEKTEAESPRKN